MSLLSFLTVIGLRTVSWKRSTGPLLVVLLFHLQMQWTHPAWSGVASMDNFQVLHGSSYICTACQDECFHSYIFEWGALSLWESYQIMASLCNSPSGRAYTRTCIAQRVLLLQTFQVTVTYLLCPLSSLRPQRSLLLACKSNRLQQSAHCKMGWIGLTRLW